MGIIIESCIPTLGLVLVFGPSIKNYQFWLLFVRGLCFYILLSWGLHVHHLGSYPLMLLLSLAVWLVDVVHVYLGWVLLL